jgi:predicted transcriptional regulator
VRTDLPDGTKKIAWKRNGSWGLKGFLLVDMPLYGLEDLLKAPAGARVVVTEGEKCRDALTARGVLAVATVCGAGVIPNAPVLAVLRGYDVRLWPDNDDPGEEHMQGIASRLAELGTQSRIVRWTEAPPKGDAADFLGNDDSLTTLIEAAQPWTPSAAKAVVTAETGKAAPIQPPGFNLTTLADLLAEPPESRRWLWERTFPAGGVSIIAAKPKVGKSTLARNLALRVVRGEPMLGRTTTLGAVVYLALEEKRAEVADHFRRMGAGVNDGGAIHIHVGRAPQEALAALAAAIHATGAQLAIVDPLFRLIRLSDVNDYASVTNAFEPLVALARDTGCHIACLHHLGKGLREAGDAILGSTAIFAAVDTVIAMRKRDSLRVVSSIQRYGEDMPETTLAFDVPTGIVTEGGLLEHAVLVDAAERLLGVLESGALSEAEIRDGVDGDNTAIGKALRALVKMGWLTRDGGGKKGDPYRYSPSENTPHGDATERRSKILAFLAETYSSSEKARNNLVAFSPETTPRILASQTTSA